MAWVGRARRRQRRHRGSDPQPCLCPVSVRAHALWVESIARHRAAGVTHWQFALGGPALAESMVIITDDPERCADALTAAQLRAHGVRLREFVVL
jgi:hypothetical protein